MGGGGEWFVSRQGVEFSFNLFLFFPVALAGDCIQYLLWLTLAPLLYRAGMHTETFSRGEGGGIDGVPMCQN